MNSASNNFCTLVLAAAALSGPMWCFFWTIGLWRGFTFNRCSITVGAMPGIFLGPKVNTSLYSYRSKSIESRSTVVISQPSWSVHSRRSSSSGTCSTSSVASSRNRGCSAEVKVWITKASRATGGGLALALFSVWDGLSGPCSFTHSTRGRMLIR